MPDIDLQNLSFEELIAMRQAIDARLESMKAELAEKAERLGLKIMPAKKKSGRRLKTHDAG
jgi:hypothetical protein